VFIVTEGSIVDDHGNDQGSIVGACAQLKGEPIAASLWSGPQGCVGLVLPRGKFLTLAQDRPHVISAIPSLATIATP
jgi:hypothetical protein